MEQTRIRHPEVGGILHLEHVNFPVADYDMATAFFMAGLGFTRDPFTRADETNMAVNVGLQQFPDSGATVFAFGNEVRSVYHFDFMRPLVNRWPMRDELPYYQRDPERENKRRPPGVMPGP
jgi:hypothetical protein